MQPLQHFRDHVRIVVRHDTRLDVLTPKICQHGQHGVKKPVVPFHAYADQFVATD